MTIDAPPDALTARWARAKGLQDLGLAQGSGLRDASYLLQRADGQVLQVSDLLHLIITETSQDRTVSQVAEAVSEACGRELPPDGLARLISVKLEPLGLVENISDAAVGVRADPPKANPLLALRLHTTLIPTPAVRRLSGALAGFFHPAVVTLAVVAQALMDVRLIRGGGLSGALNQIWLTPTLLLALLGLLTVGSLVHELGHAAACHYGGGRPGVIGVGLYLVFPAFFTNVTDSYRLRRSARLRTDLGGLYFNVWCLLFLSAGYLTTGNGLFLLAVLLTHISMLQQLVPAVRFDGYFVLADLAGVPDLFARIRPVLRSLVPGQPVDHRVSQLRPAARRLVIGWVLIVVPLLVLSFGWILYKLPYLVKHTASAIALQTRVVAATFGTREVPTFILAALSIVLLALPTLGLLILSYRLAKIALRLIGRAVTIEHTDRADTAQQQQPAQQQPQPRPPATKPRHTDVPVAPSDTDGAKPAHSAADFTDDVVLLPRHGQPPTMGWRRAVYAATSGAWNPGPSAAERRRDEILARITEPIQGSRRVVVMSRKGGVGKTTMTLALGSTFAMLRGDRVVAVDANPDAGNLAHRVSHPSSRTITDVLSVMDLISSYADLREFTAQAPESRLEVLASDDDPRIGMALDQEAYHRIIELLDHYYNLILLDTGTGILDSANQGLLTEADQLVLVLKPALDGARAAALTLDWLSEHGYRELVAGAVVVINATRRDVEVSVDKIREHFAQRCSEVVTVPWDPALEAGAKTRLSDLRPATRDALILLAAAVADHFVAQNPTPKAENSRSSR